MVVAACILVWIPVVGVGKEHWCWEGKLVVLCGQLEAKTCESRIFFIKVIPSLPTVWWDLGTVAYRKDILKWNFGNGLILLIRYWKILKVDLKFRNTWIWLLNKWFTILEHVLVVSKGRVRDKISLIKLAKVLKILGSLSTSRVDTHF